MLTGANKNEENQIGESMECHSLLTWEYQWTYTNTKNNYKLITVKFILRSML